MTKEFKTQVYKNHTVVQIINASDLAQLAFKKYIKTANVELTRDYIDRLEIRFDNEFSHVILKELFNIFLTEVC